MSDPKLAGRSTFGIMFGSILELERFGTTVSTSSSSSSISLSSMSSISSMSSFSSSTVFLVFVFSEEAEAEDDLLAPKPSVPCTCAEEGFVDVFTCAS